MSVSPHLVNDPAAYVPRLVREWVSDDATSRSRHRSLDGSMVFADVSGFTKLSERLAKHGKVGAETITDIIETCFTELINRAYAHGGTLLQFGGDALLLFFRGPDHARRAAAAALSLRECLRELREFTARVGKVPLSMTIGVHTDQFDFFLVGRSHRQLIVGGRGVTTLATLEGHAEKGQILVTDATARELSPRNLGRRLEHGHVLRGAIEIESSDTVSFLDVGRDMEPFIPVGLRHALHTGTIQSEHRTATVAFVEYRGLDRLLDEAGPDETAARLDALTVGVQAAIDHREICFQSADLGADGGKFYLSLGAPRSTGNDEEFMLLALREIIELDVGLAVRAGVNAGSVFTGEIRTRHRHTFITMGDAVNLAARVMSNAAPGEVLATAPVLERSRTLFATDVVPPFMVKGKSQPVTAARVGPARGTRTSIASADLPLVGREAEIESFRAALIAASQGHGTSIELVAEPGAGKSRLLDQFQVEAGHVVFRRIKCRLYQSTTPYFVVAELLRDVLGLHDRSPDEQIGVLWRAVEAADPTLVPWLSLIASTLALDIEPSPEAMLLEAEYRKDRLESAVVGLLARVLNRVNVLCFEDTHWMDDASSDVIAALLAALRVRPWVAILARRSGSARGAFEGRDADVLLELAPLGAAALGELVRISTESNPLAPHVVAALVERSGGNPLFLLELIHGVQTGGDLESLPTSVEGLLTARIDRLGTDDRATLRHLSVLGAGFAAAYSVDVLPDEVRDAPLDVLQRLDEFVRVDDEGWVSFRHHLVRDVAYEGLPFRTRRALHHKVADSILRRVGDQTDEVAGLLSLHFFHAQLHDQAWHWSRLAGDGARVIYANVDAITLYRRALTSSHHVSLPPDDTATVLEALGEVQELAGTFDGARRSFGAARGVRRGDPLGQARLTLKIAFIDERLGRFASAIRSIRRGQQLLDGVDGREAIALRAQLAVWFAAVRLGQGRFTEAVPASEASIRFAEAADDASTLARASLTLDYARLSLGISTDVSASRRALEIYTEIGDLSGEATAANVLGGYAFFGGRWQDAADLYRRSQRARERTGDAVNAALCSANLAEILIEQGRLEEADARLGDVLGVWQAAGDARGVALAYRLRGMTRSRAGHVAAGGEMLADSRRGFAAIGAAGDVVETDVAIAEHLVLSGRSDEALALLDDIAARTRGDEAGFDHLDSWMHRLRGIALFEQHPDAALAEVVTALGLAREREADHDIAHALHLAALLHEWAGEPIDQAVLDERDEIDERLGIRSRRTPPRPDRVTSGT